MSLALYLSRVRSKDLLGGRSGMQAVHFEPPWTAVVML
jgi:hypothetical protein